MKTLFFFLNLCALFLSSFGLNAKVPTLQEFHVATVASNDHPGLERLLFSCKFFHIDIDVLGFGEPYESNRDKIVHIRKYLDKIPDDHVVMFVDGFDTFFCTDKKTILDKFLELNKPCIFSVGYSTHSLVKRFPESPTKFKSLNSGTYIAYAGLLKKLFSKLDLKYTSDQKNISLYYFKHPEEFWLDYYCVFSIPLNKIKSSEVRANPNDKTIECLLTNTKPFVIHGNYKGRQLYQRLFNKLFSKEFKSYRESQKKIKGEQ
jgi:hypothetical protein